MVKVYKYPSSKFENMPANIQITEKSLIEVPFASWPAKNLKYLVLVDQQFIEFFYFMKPNVSNFFLSLYQIEREVSKSSKGRFWEYIKERRGGIKIIN